MNEIDKREMYEKYLIMYRKSTVGISRTWFLRQEI